MYKLAELLEGCLPTDHSQHRNAQHMAREALKRTAVKSVLDVGCGDGNSSDLFEQWQPGLRWVGVDIEDSPEVRRRRRIDREFHSFDGKPLPFSDSSFDLLYSSQVLEHVRWPFELMSEMVRVLKPGSYLAGSTSHLEPYHSYSLWNFTPFGFKVMAEECDF